MKARLTFLLKDQAAIDVVLDSVHRYTLGRANDNDIVISDPSISQYHAELYQENDFWLLQDCQSQNGLWVDNQSLDCCVLTDQLSGLLGNVPFMVEHLSQQRLDAEFANNDWRTAQSQRIISNLDPEQQDNIFAEYISAVVQLTNMERGLLLLGDSLETMRIHAISGLAAKELNLQEFSGSVGAIEQASTDREALVAMDTSNHPMLSSRDTTTLKNIAALACVPLLQGEQLLGLIYTDSQTAGKVLRRLDFDILISLADQIAANIYSLSINDNLIRLIDKVRNLPHQTLLDIPLERIHQSKLG